jgi:hypothetical protein
MHACAHSARVSPSDGTAARANSRARSRCARS